MYRPCTNSGGCMLHSYFRGNRTLPSDVMWDSCWTKWHCSTSTPWFLRVSLDNQHFTIAQYSFILIPWNVLYPWSRSTLSHPLRLDWGWERQIHGYTLLRIASKSEDAFGKKARHTSVLNIAVTKAMAYIRLVRCWVWLHILSREFQLHCQFAVLIPNKRQKGNF
jgi:hypothetical protein